MIDRLLRGHGLILFQIFFRTDTAGASHRLILYPSGQDSDAGGCQ